MFERTICYFICIIFSFLIGYIIKFYYIHANQDIRKHNQENSINLLCSSICVNTFKNQTRTQLETISKIDDLEKVQLEWINLAKQKNDNTFDQDDEINEQENKKETKANEDLQESESESDDDDEPKGGRKIPIVELVKGFIPRLLRPEPQE